MNVHIDIKKNRICKKEIKKYYGLTHNRVSFAKEKE